MEQLVNLALVLCLIWTSGITQTTAAIPPLINPAEGIADGVNVTPTLPVMNVDNSDHLLYYLDAKASAWKTYPYPLGLTQITATSVQSDGTYLLSQDGFDPPNARNAEGLWIFDPHRGTVALPQFACGVLRDLPGEGIWISYQKPGAERQYMCFTETGALGAALPDILQQHMGAIGINPLALSPDKRWMLFTDLNHAYALYAYAVMSQQFVFLGQGKEAELIDVVQWVDSTHPIIQSRDMQKEAIRSTYIADVSRANRLELIASLIHTWPKYYANPPRYEWVPSEFWFSEDAQGQVQHSCRIHAYDLTTRQLRVYAEIPGICGAGLVLPNGDRLDRSVAIPTVDNPTASLIRFNPVTGQWHSLFTGKIESLDSISPAGTYAALIMDNRPSVLPAGADKDPQYEFATQLVSPYLAFLDLKTQQIVYSTRLHPVSGDMTSVYPVVDWISDSTALLTDSTPTDNMQRLLSSSRLVRLENKPVLDASVGYLGSGEPGSPYQTSISPDKQHLLLWKEDPDLAGPVSVFTIATGKLTLLTKALDANKYRLEVRWHTPSLIEITVLDRQRSTPFELADWLVQLPA